MDKYMTPGWTGVAIIAVVVYFISDLLLTGVWVGSSLILHSWYSTFK